MTRLPDETVDGYVIVECTYYGLSDRFDEVSDAYGRRRATAAECLTLDGLPWPVIEALLRRRREREEKP